MAKVKCGLIQMALKGDGSMEPEAIRDRMIEAHIPYIEDAAKQGVQVLCFDWSPHKMLIFARFLLM